VHTCSTSMHALVMPASAARASTPCSTTFFRSR
jgi:hypothetical protein